MHKLIAPLLLTTILTAGCTAGATTGANVGTSPAPGATTAPGMTGGTGAAAQAFFAMGRSWDYTMKTTAAGQNFDGTFKIEVSEVKDDKATIKVTTNMPPAAPTSTTQTVSVNDQNAFNAQNKTQVSTPKSTSTESVTVPAGTFTAVKSVYEQTQEGATSTVETWIVEGVGMVKQTQTTKPPASTSMPNIPGMPAGGLDLTSTTRIELTKFTK
jgi:hypothetical protein